MANFEKQFQEEVRRLARKETKEELQRLRREVAELHRQLAVLKKELAAQTSTSHLGAAPLTRADSSSAPPSPWRVTGPGIRALRQRLGLTQAQFGRILGVSGQSVYQWERQQGQLRLRVATRQALARAKDMRRNEAASLLADTEA